MAITRVGKPRQYRVEPCGGTPVAGRQVGQPKLAAPVEQADPGDSVVGRCHDAEVVRVRYPTSKVVRALVGKPRRKKYRDRLDGRPCTAVR
jgi:hypothetical protein